MRTVLVTGAARGIGAACGEAFEQIGDRVIRTDIEDTDLTKREQVERLFGSLQSLDVLVANAGVLYSKTTLDASDEDWQSCLDVNLRSVWWCARAAHPLLKKSGNGAIITIASAQGVRSGKSSFPYSAAKGGLLALTRSMAVEYAPRLRAFARSLILHSFLTRLRLESVWCRPFRWGDSESRKTSQRLFDFWHPKMPHGSRVPTFMLMAVVMRLFRTSRI
jgi:NADP-dependent 3-hydroxy acid dehydrogenase YdfG